MTTTSNFKIVTTLSGEGLRTYGDRFLKSMQKNWPAAKLEIYLHNSDRLPVAEGAKFFRLEDTPDWQRLKEMLPDGKDGPSLAYSFKAIAMAQAVEPGLEWLAFVDGDVEIMQPVEAADLVHLFNPEYDLTYLWRKAVRESEGSWFAFNLTTPAGASLLSDFYGIYMSGEFAHYKKAHDNALLDRLVAIHKAHGLRVLNLAEGALGLDAFHQSPLARFAVHYKGPNKSTVADPGMAVPGRYALLCDIVGQIAGTKENFSFVEVGTWNGSRAVQMANAAFEAGAKIVTYVGFDTFDAGNDRAFEGHTKPHASYDIVRGRLENYAAVMRRQGLEFRATLVQGDSTITLPQQLSLSVDFAYIDGGHSYPTTKSDYENLKHVPYIVFDDVLAEEEGAPEGPRRVIYEHITDKKIKVVRTGDGYLGLEGDIAFGVVVSLDKEMPQIRQNLKVQPKHSADPSVQIDAIKTNSREADWLKVYQAHAHEALVVSAGPSLDANLGELRRRWMEGGVIFAVKHAMPKLMAAGIYPEFVVLLDPRPPTERSTHGIKRTELLNAISGVTTALVATITNIEAVEYLRANNVPMRMWHHVSGMNLGEDLPELKRGLVIRGGTCAATCIPSIASIMGFRRMTFFGYDFCYPANTPQESLEQELMKVRLEGMDEAMTTTGELIAAIQDLEAFVPWMQQQHLTIEFIGEGAGPAVWRVMSQGYSPPAEFDEDWI